MAKKKKTFDRSDIISLTALLMSMVAVFVSIYEARILKEQQLIMQTQEKTSVWPYLDGALSYEYSDKIRIRFDFENKGIGPAKIRKMTLLFQEEPIKDYVDLMNKLDTFFPKEADMGVSYKLVEGDVISPGEQFTNLQIESNRFPGDLSKLRELDLHFDVCYCSVYDDCWSIDHQDTRNRPACE